MASHGVRLLLVVAVACLGAAHAASAELVFFSTGRSMSVKGHRQEGSDLVLLLRGGGEVVCPSSIVTRIAPDEVPIPDETRAEGPASGIEVPPAYRALIEQSAAKHGVDANLVRAIIKVESAYRAAARSRKGAIGLMQLMPDTARRFAVRNPWDPGANIDGGIRYLKFLLDRFDVNVPLAVAAYNAGETAVERFNGIPPYAETRNYVRAVLSLVGQ